MRIPAQRTAGHPARLSARRALTVLACLTGLAAAATQAYAAPSTTGSADRSTVQLPGQQPPQTLTLLTGDRATLSPAGGDHYTLTATATPRQSGPTPPIRATSHTSASGHQDAIYAIPADAAALVQSGLVDKELFDVSYLAEHGYDSANLPVVVHYAGDPTAATLTQRATDLPASTFVAADAATGQAQVNVDTADPSAFWDAVTTVATPDTRGPKGAIHIDQPIPDRQLASGIALISLAGHAATPTATVPPAGEPLYTVTETIHGSKDTKKWCGSAQALCLEVPTFVLLGVTGPAAGSSFSPSNAVCVDGDPCTTYELDYQVPAGVYSADGQAVFVNSLSRLQFLDLLNPEVQVTRNTGFDVDANDEQQVTVDTPLPTEAVGLTYSAYRSLPDGSNLVDMTFVAYGYQFLWSVPTAAATVGTFHFMSRWVLGRPQVRMQLATSDAATLHPSYPIYYDAPELSRPLVRFPSHLRAQVVNAGGGTSEDFAGIDARGKLALIRVKTFRGCRVFSDQMDNAAKAGAVGVLFDPTDPAQPDSDCGGPLYPNWWYTDDEPTPTIPYAGLPLVEAHSLINQLTRGPVAITVTDGGNSPYLYPLSFYQEGRIAAAQHHAVTAKQTVLVHANYHSSEPAFALAEFATFRPNETLTGGVSYEHLAAPAALTEYIGPVSPDLVTFQDLQLGNAPYQTRYDVFSAGGTSRTIDWDQAPAAQGAPTLPADVFAAQPGKFNGADAYVQACSACRQGNTFYPWVYLVAGADPRVIDGPYSYTATHLYAGDQEVPLNDGLPSYTLPPDPAQYRLTMDGTNTHTEWHFTSGAPAEDGTPDGTVCIGTLLGTDDPCQAIPLVFLRYDAGLSLANTVTAPGQHQITVSAYHQAPGAPAITSLRLWISTDGGSTWQQEQVGNRGHGDYGSSYVLPTRAHTNGAVSIKVQARDADGNDVVQVLDNAFAITG
jgi:hypothetical protein